MADSQGIVEEVEQTPLRNIEREDSSNDGGDDKQQKHTKHPKHKEYHAAGITDLNDSDDDSESNDNDGNHIHGVGGAGLSSGGVAGVRRASSVRTPHINREMSVLTMGGYNTIENGVSLTWKNLTYTVNESKPNEKTILHNLSGYVGPGNVLVIMGPSGSGKTSLLSILSGNRAFTSGEIHYQGKLKSNPIGRAHEDVMGFKGNASYVAQDDILMGSLTVKETLQYAARLKISDSDVDKEAQIDGIIKYLGLEVCQDALVGNQFIKGISGGQKRRLSIGIELVTQPGLLFLDEVTSGLDATSAYQLLRLIAKLSKLGHSIVMTLHQPTSRLFKLMCDAEFYMLILESGNESYFGYARDSIDFFAHLGYKVPPFNNATDYFLDLVNRDFESSLQAVTGDNNNNKNSNFTADIINESFAKDYQPHIDNEIDKINEEFQKKTSPKLKPNNIIKQFLILLHRSFFNVLRNPGIFWIRLSNAVVLSLALGSLYWDIPNTSDSTIDRLSILFFCLTFFTFMAISAIPAFIEEREVFMRERMNNHYSTIAFVTSNFVGAIPWQAILALVTSGILYPMIHLRWDPDKFGVFLLNYFVVYLVSENMMVCLSALSSLFIVGLGIGSSLLGLYMVLGGYMIKSSNIPDGWKWAEYGLSFHRWSWQIFMYNDFHDNFNVDIGDTGNGNEILKDWGMDDVDIPFNFLILCIMIAGYRIIFYLLIKYFNTRQK